MGRKLLALALALTLAVAGFAVALAEERAKVTIANGKQFYETGLPIVDEDSGIELTIWGVTTASDPNEFPMVKRYFEDTGVNVRWIGVSSDGLPERKNLMWASGDYPDILGPSVPSEGDIQMYGPMGIIIPLNEYIEKYLTTFRENCGGQDVWDATWAKLTYPDGSIYTYPTVMDYFYCDSTVPSINIDWLEALNMQVPQTPDEFVEYLRACKATDLNGNGKNDEIPFVTQNWRGIFESYAIAGWTGELAGTKYIEDGKVVYPIASDAIREAATWLHGIWEEGLMDPEIYTQDENMMKAKAQGADLAYGFSTVWREGNVFGEVNGLSYYPMAPLQGDGGTRMWYGTQDKNLVMTQWCVTSACEYPEVVARWVDYMYDPLISMQSNHAPIEYGYEEMSDGTYKQIVPEGFATVGEFFIDNHFQQCPRLCVGTYLTTNGGLGMIWTNPEEPDWQLMTERFVAGMVGGNQKRVHDMVLGDYIVTAFPPVKNAQEETDELSLLLPDFEKYVRESLTRFVTGQMSIENEWDAFAAQVDRLGYQRILAIYQAQYDRYVAASA